VAVSPGFYFAFSVLVKRWLVSEGCSEMRTRGKNCDIQYDAHSTVTNRVKSESNNASAKKQNERQISNGYFKKSIIFILPALLRGSLQAEQLECTLKHFFSTVVRTVEYRMHFGIKKLRTQASVLPTGDR